jgi:hypothetical protein
VRPLDVVDLFTFPIKNDDDDSKTSVRVSLGHGQGTTLELVHYFAGRSTINIRIRIYRRIRDASLNIKRRRNSSKFLIRQCGLIEEFQTQRQMSGSRSKLLTGNSSSLFVNAPRQWCVDGMPILKSDRL